MSVSQGVVVVAFLLLVGFAISTCNAAVKFDRAYQAASDSLVVVKAQLVELREADARQDTVVQVRREVVVQRVAELQQVDSVALVEARNAEDTLRAVVPEEHQPLVDRLVRSYDRRLEIKDEIILEKDSLIVDLDASLVLKDERIRSLEESLERSEDLRSKAEDRAGFHVNIDGKKAALITAAAGLAVGLAL